MLITISPSSFYVSNDGNTNALISGLSHWVLSSCHDVPRFKVITLLQHAQHYLAFFEIDTNLNIYKIVVGLLCFVFFNTGESVL